MESAGPLEGDCGRKSVNPSEVIKSRVFAPLSRALVGRGGARDVLGWTAVAQCPTLSAKYFSVSYRISICLASKVGILPISTETSRKLFRRLETLSGR